MAQTTDPASFDRFALDYDRFVELLPGRNTSWLAGLGLKGARALDAGCGSGHAVELLSRDFEEARRAAPADHAGTASCST